MKKAILIISLILFSFFEGVIAQIDLPPVIISCIDATTTSIEISWDSLENASEYIVFIDLWAVPDIIDTVIDNSFKIENLAVNGSGTFLFEVTALGNQGYNNTMSTLYCQKLSCPNVELEVFFDFKLFCTNIDSIIQIQYDLNVISSDTIWGNGIIDFSGLGINQQGQIDLKSLKPGNHVFQMKYEEQECVYTAPTFSLGIVDTKPVEIKCIQDTALNFLGVNWSQRPFSDGFQVFINDSLISTQTSSGYIYHPQFPGEEIDIKIQPIGSHGCEYAPGYLTCTAPILSNSKEFFEKEVVSVFPNPSSGVFEVFSEERIERIEVFDFSGKEWKVVFESEVDLSEFGAGVYFLKIYFGEEVVLKKVIKM